MDAINYEVRRPGRRGELIGLFQLSASVEPSSCNDIQFLINNPEQDELLGRWLRSGRAACMEVVIKRLQWEFRADLNRHVLTTDLPVETLKRHLPGFRGSARDPRVFLVEGSGPFPIDMLCRERCWPRSREDCLAISASLGYIGSVAVWRVRLETNEEKNFDGRWEGSGWRVIATVGG